MKFKLINRSGERKHGKRRRPRLGKSMPEQRPGKSVQIVQTDPKFIAAVEARFGKLIVDLAANEENRQAPSFIGEDEDSLQVDWTELRGNLWLNPPFGNIKPWAQKCVRTLKKGWSGDGSVKTCIMLLVPASVGSRWFQRYVFEKARVYFLSRRLTFVGHKQPYPKDCILAVFGKEPGFEMWDWSSQ